MKKFLLIAIAACAVLSCTKSMDDVQKPITFTAEIAGDDTKTTVSTDGKVAWVVGDEVSVSNGENTSVYSVSAVGDNRKATLTFKSGTEFTGAGEYTATYGNVNDQWYDESNPGSNCPMSASATTTEGSGAFMFKNSCGVVAVTANTEDIAIAKIMLGNTALNFATAKKLKGTYLVAVPADEPFTSVTFVKADGAKAEKTGSASVKVGLNKLRALDTKSYFSVASNYSGFEPIALSGKFTVDATGKTVRFAKGNLWCDASNTSSLKWYFESDQFTASQTKYDATHVDHFFYRTNGGYESNPGYLANYQQVDWGQVAFGTGSKWTTLSPAEWTYMTDNNKRNDWAIFSNMNGKKVFLLLPKGFTWDTATMGTKPTFRQNNSGTYTASNAQDIENAGGVFLVFAGQRVYNENNMKYTDFAYYGEYAVSATIKIATGTGFSCTSNDGANIAYSIRLVQVVE